MTQRIFEPIVSTFLLTDGVNHDSKVEFKISYGIELDNPSPVFKVQMVGEGKVKGRQAPSYSDDDFDKVIKIREALKKEFDKTDRRVRDGRFEIPGLTNEESIFSKS